MIGFREDWHAHGHVNEKKFKCNPIWIKTCWATLLKYIFFVLIQRLPHFYVITLNRASFNTWSVWKTQHFSDLVISFSFFLTVLCNRNFLFLSVWIKISHCTYSFLLQQSNALISCSFALPSLKNSPEGSERKWTYLNVPETDGDTVSSPESSALAFFKSFSLLSPFLLKTVPVCLLYVRI